MKKLGFLYFGRLDHEKWFDMILDMIQKFGWNKKDIPFDVFVFGTGEYGSQILDLSEKYESVHYFGFQPLATIVRYVPSCQYCLMPSVFLETFGLSAVNALSWGLPVIGYKKWWLFPFVLDELDLGQIGGRYKKEAAFYMVNNLVKWKFDNKKWRWMREKALEIADKYHSVDWERKIEKLIGDKKVKKILLVTDFVTKLGGIETYVWDSKKVLEGMKYEVKVVGKKISRGWIGKVLRYWGLFLAIWNFVFAIRLYFVQRKFGADVVWFHSVLRWIGWMGLMVNAGWWKHKVVDMLSWTKSKDIVSPNSWKILGRSQEWQIQVWLMFHDFGYFHPFPRSVVDEKQIQTPLTLRNYLKWADGIVKKVFAAGKYINVVLIKRVAKKKVDKFLVPSEYMKKIVMNSYGLEDYRVEVLEHFVQE